MKCPVCGYDRPINYWITLKDVSSKSVVAPRINYYTLPGQNQYDSVYACPKCGVLKIRKAGDR